MPVIGTMRHRLDAAGDHDVVPARRDRLPAAIAIACRPLEQKRLMVMRRGLLRQPAEEPGRPRDVEALLALGHRAAEDDVVDDLGLHLRDAREQPANDLARELVGPLLREGALVCAADGASERRRAMTMSVLAMLLVSSPVSS